MTDNQTRILYIASDSRSGSTVLDLMLGQGEGMFSVGELRHIWRRGYLKNELCGCGQPFRECGFWQAVTRCAFGGFAEADRLAARFADAAPTRMRHMPLLMTLWPASDSTRMLASFSEALGKLYAAIQRVSGAKVIVDSSKTPTYGLLLSHISTINLSLLHLVRDSRAVAYSWQRQKLRPEVYWKREYMPQFGLLHSARAWMLNNTMIHALVRATHQEPLFMRYRDAVTCPDEAMQRVHDYLDAQDIEVRFPSYEDRAVPITCNHTVAGNPIRLTNEGMLRLKADTEWTHAMTARQKRIVTLLTAPLLARYGYLKPRYEEAGMHSEQEPCIS